MGVMDHVPNVTLLDPRLRKHSTQAVCGYVEESVCLQ